MHKYELGVIVRPQLDEEALKAELAAIHELVERFGGVIEKVDDWGKRKLAYEIDKQTEGFYQFITINAPAEMPQEVESRLNIRENVMRYLTINKDHVV